MNTIVANFVDMLFTLIIYIYIYIYIYNSSLFTTNEKLKVDVMSYHMVTAFKLVQSLCVCSHPKPNSKKCIYLKMALKCK